MTKEKLIFTYAFNQTFHWLIMGILIPISALLQLEKGLNLLHIGISAAVYSGTVVVLELPTGGLADSIGRKRVYLFSLVAQFIGGIAILTSWNFPTMLSGFFCAGIARALSSGSIEAWFVDEFNRLEPKGNLQQAYATAGIFIPLGLGIGALLGGFLPMTLGQLTDKIPGMGMYSANILVIMFFVIIQFILTSTMVVEHLHPTRSGSVFAGLKQFPEILSTAIKSGIQNKVIFMLMLASFAWGIGFSSLEQFWQPQVKNILGSDSNTWIFGLLTTGYFLAGAVGNILITPLCALFKNRYAQILFVSRLLIGVFFLILTLQTKLAGFTVIYLVLFLCNGMSGSPHAAIFNSYVEEKHRSTILSLESFFLQIGGLLCVILTGYLAQKFSISKAWLLGAGILTLSSIVYLILPVFEKKTPHSVDLSR